MKNKSKVLFLITIALGMLYIYKKTSGYEELMDDENSIRVASTSFISLDADDIEIMYGTKTKSNKYLRTRKI